MTDTVAVARRVQWGVHQLTHDYADYFTAFLETSGEVTPELEAQGRALAARAASQVEQYACALDALDKLAKAMHETQREYEARVKAMGKLLQSMKDGLKEHMEERQVAALEAGLAKIWIQANGGTPGIELLVIPEELPQDYQRVTVTANVDIMRLHADEDGVIRHHGRALGRVKERGTHLRYKVMP